MRGRRSAEGAEAGLNRPCAGNRQKDGSKLTEGLNSGAEKKTVIHADAGLRVLLTAQKTMNKQGGMIVGNVNDAIMEVVEITGFSDILTIER